jgi:hypothetical protein
MLSAIAARDAIGDRAFEEGREPMTDEWAMMKEQQRKHDSYADMLGDILARAIEKAAEKIA